MSTDKKYPPVVIVDEHDSEVGSAMLAEAWKKGLYYRIVAVFVEDEEGQILLQLRGPQVINPNHWDQAAGGHVDEGQSYEQAAMNELSEELGIQDVELKELGTFRINKKTDDGRIINRFERVYLARIPHDTPLKPEPDEISELRWFAPSELRTQIDQQPGSFTEGLRYILDEYIHLS
jgi:isopentenyl-diphosphate Delta-isomerase